MIHGLCAVQLGNGRQHAKGVAGQHDDVFRVFGAPGGRGIGDKVQRIGHAGILGFGRVVKIRNAGDGVNHHIFHHGAEALGGGENFRLGLARQFDGLGIAAALKIKDAVLAPAMLVVADENARRIRRERGFAGAGQAEKHGCVARLIGIGRTVHRHDLGFGQHEIEIGEHRFFHFTGIGGAADQHDLAGEITGDNGFGAAAVTLRVCFEGGQVDNREVGHKAGQFIGCGADQQIADEQRMPGIFSDNTRLDAVGRVGAAKQILYIKRLALCMFYEISMEQVKLFNTQRAIVLPPNLGQGQRIAHNIFVLG